MQILLILYRSIDKGYHITFLRTFRLKITLVRDRKAAFLKINDIIDVIRFKLKRLGVISIIAVILILKWLA